MDFLILLLYLKFKFSDNKRTLGDMESMDSRTTEVGSDVSSPEEFNSSSLPPDCHERNTVYTGNTDNTGQPRQPGNPGNPRHPTKPAATSPLSITSATPHIHPDVTE